MHHRVTAGTFDELGPKLKARWGGVAPVIHLDLPPDLRDDIGAVRRLIEALR